MRVVTPTLLALLLALPVAAQQGEIRVPSEQFTLPNGLRVILHRDTTTPTIATNIWYHVGSAHEVPGRTGFAHLFEHILFEGSQNVPEGKIDEWFNEVGGSPNGSTEPDRTNYMQQFMSNALDMALFIESDRMGHLLPAMSEGSVDGQRDIVKNERREAYDNPPYGLADQVLTEALYPATHPYSWPVIGYMDHLTNASYQDVADFFRKYYAPNNATMVIAGDIDAARTRALVEKWFADVPRGEAVAPLQAPPPRLAEAKLLTLEDAVQLPRVYMRWVSSPRYDTDDAALLMLADILGSGKSSRLYKRLVYDLQIADDVYAYQQGLKLAGNFEVAATARAGHDLDELERVIVEEVTRLATAPPSAEELQRVVNQFEIGFLEQLEVVSAKADRMNEYLYYTGQPDYFAQDLARFRRLTPQDISAAAQRWLGMNARVVLSVVPEGRQELAVEGSRVVPKRDLELSPSNRKPTS